VIANAFALMLMSVRLTVSVRRYSAWAGTVAARRIPHRGCEFWGMIDAGKEKAHERLAGRKECSLDLKTSRACSMVLLARRDAEVNASR